MADNRLVPYSVHLKRDVYDKLKLVAVERKEEQRGKAVGRLSQATGKW
jgi:hypothetical protein